MLQFRCKAKFDVGGPWTYQDTIYTRFNHCVRVFRSLQKNHQGSAIQVRQFNPNVTTELYFWDLRRTVEPSGWGRIGPNNQFAYKIVFNTNAREDFTF